MRIRPDLIESFVVVAQQGSFTRASAMLGIGASSLSDRIRSLEEQIGFPLFHRTTRRTLITRHGRNLLIHAERTLDSIRKMECAAAEIEEAAHGAIVVGAGPYGGCQRSQIIEQFTRRHPDVQVRLVLHPDQTKLFRMLREGEIDVLFGWGENPGPPFERSCAHGVEIGLIVPISTALSGSSELQADQLRGTRIVTCSEQLQGRAFRDLTIFAAAHDIEIVEVPCDNATEVLAYARGHGLPTTGCPELGTANCPADGVSFRRWVDLPVRADFHIYRDPFRPPG